MSHNLRGFVVLIVFLIFGAGLVSIGLKPSASRSGDVPPTLMPPKELKFFTLGYSELAADVLWLRVIQDFDFCERREYGQTNYDPNVAKCDQGWVFKMVDAVTDLAPNFRQAYKSGALFLSVLVNDPHGASLIFAKALDVFPSDWNLTYLAAYHAMAEEHDVEKASKLLVRSGELGAPGWVYPLAARISMKAGQLEFSKSILEGALDQQLKPEIEARVKSRLDEVNAEIEKERSH